MRHWFFLIVFLLALGALRMVGCGDDRSCVEDQDCNDGNPCTIDECYWYDPDAPQTCEVVSRCLYSQVTNGTSCGSDNVCVDGVCGQNRCEDVVCDDDDACTDDECDYVDGTCSFPPATCDDHNDCTEDTCSPADGCMFTQDPDRDGNICEGDPGGVGMCEAGACVGCDPASEEELPCPIEGLENFLCCPGAELCSETCAPCDPTSEVEYPCPVNEGAVCCPGSEYCMPQCSSGS